MGGQRTDDQEHVDGGQNIEVYAGEELDFDLVRSWEPPDVAPARQHTVAVVVRPAR